MNFTVSTILLIVAIVIFIVAGLNFHVIDNTSDVELVSAGLAFFAASFLPWRR